MKNWELKKLGEVCEFIGGSQPPKSDFSYEKKENYIRLIQIRDYKSDKHIVYVPKNKAKRFCNATDIMIGRYGPPVFQILKGLDGAYNVALMKAVPNEKVLSKNFAYLFLKYSKIQDYIIHLSQRAAGQTGVNKETIEEYPILLPSLPEQKRIVAKLNEVLEAVSSAKENSEKNLKNSKELFDSYLQEVFEKKGDGWKEKTLGEIGRPLMCKRIMKHQTSTTGEIPFYKIGTFGKTPDAFISKEIYDDFRTKYAFPKKGDILISASGTIGRRVRYDGEPAFFQDSNIVWIDNDEKQVLNDYLYVFYEFCDWQPSRGATISRLYNSNLTNIKIAFPESLREQENILKKIDALSTETQKLESVYEKKLSDLEELKKSILQKAFAGELVN